MNKIKSALFFSNISEYSAQAISLISIVVIARLLSPSELGVFSIASSAVIIFSELKSFGIGTFLIRMEKLDSITIRKALGLNIIISWLLGGSLLLFSPQIAEYYNEPDIKNIINLFSVIFFLSPYIGINHSLLVREFKFKRTALINLIKQFSQITTTLICIYFGNSYYSIAYGMIAGVIAEAAVALRYKSPHMQYLPSFWGSLHILNFGSYVTLSSMSRKLSLSMTDLVIGKLGTTSQVALFSRGIGFLDFVSHTITQGINPVITPYLSDTKRSGLSVSHAYAECSNLLTIILWPIFVIAGIASSQVILLFFGSQWLESANFVSILCLWAILKSVHAFASSLFITTHNEKLLFFKDLIILISTFLAVYCLFPYGLKAICWGLVCIALLELIIISSVFKYKLNIEIGYFIKHLSYSVYITVICAITTYFLHHWILNFHLNNLLHLILLGSGTLCIWTVLIYKLKHSIYTKLTIK